MVSMHLDQEMLSIRTALDTLEQSYRDKGGMPIIDARLIEHISDKNYCNFDSLAKGRIGAYQDLWDLRNKAENETGFYADAFRRQIHSLLYQIWQRLLPIEDRDDGFSYFRNHHHFEFIPCSLERVSVYGNRLLKTMNQAKELSIPLNYNTKEVDDIPNLDFRDVFHNSFPRLDACYGLEAGETELQRYMGCLIDYSKIFTQKLMNRFDNINFTYEIKTYDGKDTNFAWLDVVHRHFSLGINLNTFGINKNRQATSLTKAAVHRLVYHEFAGHAVQFLNWIDNKDVPKSFCITTNFTPEVSAIEALAEGISFYMMDHQDYEQDSKESVCIKLYKDWMVYDRTLRSHMFEALFRDGEKAAIDKFWQLFPGFKSDAHIVENATVQAHNNLWNKHTYALPCIIINFMETVRDDIGDQKYAEFLGELLTHYCDAHILMYFARKHGYDGKGLVLTDNLANLPDPSVLESMTDSVQETKEIAGLDLKG